MPLRGGGAEERGAEDPCPEGTEGLAGGEDVDGALWCEVAEPAGDVGG